MNILFICKHNVFRSKVAEAYFNKINRNKNIQASSAGMIRADVLNNQEKEVSNLQKKTAREFGIDIKGESRTLSIGLLRKQNRIIIVADNVPESLFKEKGYLDSSIKVIVWKVPDITVEKSDIPSIRKSIKMIIKQADKLNKELK